MKNLKFKSVLALFFVVIFISPLFSQGKFTELKDADLNIWYPDNWLVREHVLLLMMPKNEDLTLQIQLTDAIDLDAVVKESISEIKDLYPEDTLIVINKFKLNEMNVREINKNVGNDKVHYFFIETPQKKIVRVFHISPKDIALKYNNDLMKIIKNIKPKN